LYFAPGADWSSSVTSSTLSTVGSRSGSRTTVSRRARSGRSSVVVKKKRRGRDRVVDARRLHAALPLVQLEAAQILRRRRIGGPADKGRERPHVPNVVVRVSSVKPRTIMSSIMRARSAVTGWGERGESSGVPLELRLLDLQCSGSDAPIVTLTAHPLTASAKNAPAPTPLSRESGFVLGWESYRSWIAGR